MLDLLTHPLDNSDRMRSMRLFASVVMFFWGSWACAGSPEPIQVETQMPAHLYQLDGNHFTVIASSDSRLVGQWVLQAAEKVRTQVMDQVGGELEHVYILLDDGSDAFNGFATPTPWPIVRVFVTFPQTYTIGMNWSDLWETLIAHELTHIAHLGQRNSFQLDFHRVFGNIPLPGVTQARQAPAWLIEGLAVWVESFGREGRLQDPYSGLVTARAALEGNFPRLDDVSVGQFDDFPFGNARYLYGGRFVDFLAQRYGRATIAQLLQVFNDAGPLPALTQTWFSVTGHRLEDDWEAFRQQELKRAQQQEDAPVPFAQTVGSYVPTVWNGETFAWWGDRALNIRSYKEGTWSDTQRYPLKSKPTGMAWDGINDRLVYTRLEEDLDGYGGDVYTLQGGQEHRLTRDAHALGVAADQGRIYYFKEISCLNPPQSACGSGVFDLEGKPILEVFGEHLFSMDVRDGEFLLGFWKAGGKHRVVLWKDGQALELAGLEKALEVHWGEQGQILYTQNEGVPQVYRYGDGQPVVKVGGGSFSGRYASGKFAYLNLTSKGFVPVISEQTLAPSHPTALPQADFSTALPELDARWSVYSPVPRVWGWLPFSTEGPGITAYLSDPTFAVSGATSIFVAPSRSHPIDGAASFVWKTSSSTQWGFWGNTAEGFGIDFTKHGQTESGIKWAVNPNLYWTNALGGDVTLSLNTLSRDAFGYPIQGAQVAVKFSPMGVAYDALLSEKGWGWHLWGTSGFSGLETSGHIVWPLKWRYQDGLVSLERISLQPKVGLANGNPFLGMGIYGDSNINYMLPVQFGFDVEYHMAKGWGISWQGGIHLPF